MSDREVEADRDASLQAALELSHAIARRPWKELRLQDFTPAIEELFSSGVWGILNVAGTRPTLDIYPVKRLPSQVMAQVIKKAIDVYNSLLEAPLEMESLRVATHEDDLAPSAVGSGRAQMQLPLIAGGRTTGLVFLYSDRLDSYAPDKIRLFSILVNQFAVTLENARLLQEASEQDPRDELTGAFTVRRFKEALEAEFRRSQRYGHRLSLALIDLDGLKAVNDRYDHPAGDEVLKQVAAIVREAVRSTDVVARCGEDEFSIILTDTDEEGANVLAQRLVDVVRVHPFRIGDLTLKMTISVGVACLQRNPTVGPQELVARADAALQEAKRTGGNIVGRFAPLTMSSTTGVTTLRRAWGQGNDWQDR